MTHNPEKSMQGDLFLSYEELCRLFENEAMSFASLFGSGLYDQIDNQYRNLHTNIKSIKIPAPLRRNGAVDFSEDKEWIREIIGLSHIAVTCHLLQGCKFATGTAHPASFQELARNAVTRFVSTHGEQGLKRLSFLLESIEGVRVEKILRALGLFTLAKEKIHQLSLGSGSGLKDLEAMYSEAKVEMGDVFHANTAKFAVSHHQASHTILVDSEPGYRERYETLNNEQAGNIMALNTDMDSAISIIEQAIDKEEIMKRNVITAFRMDPVMLPDVNAFFRSLKNITTDISYLIMSVGSGNNLEEFIARLDKLKEIRTYMNKHGMESYSIKLYRGNTPEQGFNNPLFGSRGFANFEIIFCKIKNKKLK